MPATRIVVNIPEETPYDVRVGEDLLQGLGAYCKDLPALSSCPKMLVISDSNVAPLYLPAVRNSLLEAGYRVSDISIAPGEESKAVAVAEEIWEAMAHLGFGRDCCVVALGGGVVGDLAGFVASTFMRGVPVIQVPTTLLSMVDSSVGGKTGVNLSAGKNLVGTFYQPTYVCASVDTLATLPDREWQCGCGEIAKSAALDSDDFFFWLIEHAQSLADREVSVATEAIKRSILFKANIVIEDQTESRGVRECLNYGHTLAHAIETLAGYGTYSHGAAVAEGMRFAAYLGNMVGETSSEFLEAQAELLDTLGLHKLTWNAPVDDIVAVMKRDKKVRDNTLRFTILKDVSDWKIMTVDDDAVKMALAGYFEEGR